MLEGWTHIVQLSIIMSGETKYESGGLKSFIGPDLNESEWLMV